MKKDLHRLIALFAIMFFSFSIFAQDFGSVLNESFENGIPEDWIQENVVNNQMWSVEGGDLTRPGGAFDGVKRLAFRNTTNVTTKAKTRLILPVMDISNLYQPIVIFAHAQDKWTNDFDTLKVLYRSAPEKEWVELKVFDESISKWQIDTIRLISPSKTYQLAFEGTDNLGRGIVLDDIEIRSTPNCVDPYNLFVSDVANDSFKFVWLGAFDAVAFNLKVSTFELTKEQLVDKNFKADVLDTAIIGWEYKLDGLLPATTYYWYIQSQCEDEISNWVSSTAKTSNVLELPYYEKFGSQYTAGYVTYLTDWYLFASETKPFINTNNAGDKFYTSVDNSYVLCFNGEASSAATSAIPGGSYCYAALPQINIPSLDALQLSFWTIRSHPYASERFSIIVGVMTDPTVKGSFVPVDTIDITSINDYVECVVSFENYKGEGKYITFMSDFAESNIFVMDNLSVTYRPEIVKVLFDIDIPSATSLKFNFKQQYDKYEVVVSNEKIESSLLDSSTDVVRREILNNGLVDGLNAGLEYFVYARAIKGTEKGEWSNAVRIRMPGKAEVYPYMLDLSINQSDVTTYYYSQIGNFIDTYNYLVPEIIVHTNSPFHPHTNYGELYLQSVIARKSSMTAVLPEIIDKNTRISFYATNRVGEWIANDYGCTFYVGVMSDANDPSTFVAIDTVTVGKKYEYFVYELDKYNVEGKFFALKIDEAHYYGQSNVGDLNNVYIKDVKYDFIPTCKYPTNIKVESALNNPSQVTISWDANNVSKWNVRISEVEYDRDSLAIDTFDYKYVYNDIVNTNSVVISDLKFPEVTYYYWIQPICGDEVGEWLPAYKFNTGCYHKHPIPYYENFDKEAYSTSNTEPEFTVPCMYSTRFREESQFEVFGEKDTFYPYVTSTQAINEKSLCLTRREAWGGADSYVALPKMDSPIKNLQISFKMYVTNVTHTVSVGVMENPFDNANINVVSVIRPKVVNEWIEYIVTFDDYSGKGEYIALTTNNLSAKSVELYIDDIEVNYKSTCERPENVGLVDFNDSTITIGWNDLSATSYCVMLARQRLDKEQLTEPIVNDTIFKIDTVKTNPVTITGLEENTEYYVYVQTICDGSVSYWSNPLRVRTSCKILTVGEFGIESFDSYGTGWGMYPSCFIVGNLTSDFEGCIPHCFDAYHHSGGASLRITSNTIYNGAYAIVPPLNISDISMLKVKFWGSVDPANNPYVSKNSIIVGVITDPSDLATFVPVETVKLSNNCPVEVYLDSYKGDFNGEKGKCVMFLSEFDGPNDIFIDDLEFDTIKTCETIFEIENIKDVSVDIKFNSQSTSYQLKYATEMCNVETLNKDSLPLINVTQGNTATISNLNPNTNYYLYARQMCNGSYGDWSNVKLVTTSCKMLVTLPFSDNFDNQPFESGQPMCWNVYYETADYPSLLSAYYNTPSRSVYVYSNKSGAESYLVTQEIDVDDLSKCQVGFQMRPNTTGKNRSIVVGVVSDIKHIVKTFVPVDTIIMKQSVAKFEEQLVLLDSYKGEGKYIAFYSDLELNGSANGGVMIDDIVIELIPSCAKPMRFEMRGITDKSLSIAFASSEAIKYEVKIGSVGFNPDKEGTSVLDNDTIVTIHNLTAETDYDVYVRAYCSETDFSPWAYVGKYTTLPEVIRNYPYICDFENNNENSKWRFAQGGQINQWFIGTDTAYAVTDFVNTGGKALYVSKDGGLSAQYLEKMGSDGVNPTSYSWAYRPVYLEAGVYTISYDWTCYGQTTSDYVCVGFLPVTSTFAAGANTVTASNGSSKTLTHNAKPLGWINLSTYNGNQRLSGINTTLPFNEQWVSGSYVIVVTPELAGVYNLVCYWTNNIMTGTYASTRSAVIDNIVIGKESCVQPIEFSVTDYGSYFVDLSWKSLAGTPRNYEVLATTEAGIEPDSLSESQIAVRKFVDTTSVSIQDLAENTTYYFHIRSICAEGDTSFWAPNISCKTTCAPQVIDTLYTMDIEGDSYYPAYSSGTNKKYSVPSCFVVSHENQPYNSSYALYVPHLMKNTTSRQYSRSGDYALYFYRFDNSTQPGGIIAMPLIDGDFSNLQVSFWMRCVASNPTTGTIDDITGINGSYNRKITVGTMDDPNDPSTFESLGIFEYPHDTLTKSHNVADDPTGEKYWVKCVLPLVNAKGKYIAFKNDNYGAKQCNYVYIDDIKVSPLTCFTPLSVEVNSITSTSAEISAMVADGGKHVLQISTNSNFENAITDTLLALPVKVDNLKSSTTYYVRIQTLCSDSEYSNWSAPVVFTTTTTLPYNEDFSQLGARPKGWSAASNPRLEEYLAGETSFGKVGEDLYIGWKSTNAIYTDGLFSTKHLSVSVIKNVVYWLFTPKFEMPKDENIHLTFDLALMTEDSLYLNLGIDDRFIVMISDDGGNSWKRDNMIVWGENFDDYQLSAVPTKGKQYRIDLSKYAGKTIQLAFYADSNSSENDEFVLHLDNVHINTYKEEVLAYNSCQNEDVEYDLFSISADNVQVGLNEFSHMTISETVADTMYKLNLTVLPMVETNFNASICEGDVYSKNNFEGLMNPGIYKQKLIRSNGCDSVIVLDLKVIKPEQIMLFDTICYGSSVIWNGVEYNRTGVHVDTLVSKVTGCDSIVTFVLTVKDVIRTEQYQNICFGATYQFGTQTIDKSGDYTEKFVTAAGCDSIVTLHATVLPDYRTTLNVTIFEGDTYNENGFVGLSESGTYTLPLKSKVGDCDSTITLNLKVIDPTQVAIGNVNTVDLTLVPNPVESGNTLFVNAEFTKEQTEGLLVEVFNAVGQRVYSDEPSIYPIEINGLSQRGVYWVRITAGNGNIYQGKVVVK